MYTVSIPVFLNEHFCKEEICSELKRAGANRFFLSVGKISFDPVKREATLAQLREFVPYFQSQGFETGIWFWTFWRSDIDSKTEDYLMVTASGDKRISGTSLHNGEQRHSGYCCPAQSDFVAHATSIIKALAETGPDILMFDDDFRYGFIKGHGGCFCKEHIRLCSEKLGKEITWAALVAEIYADMPSQTRTAWQEVLGETLENFAVRIREAVDSVNPHIRFALCSVMSLWDIDGTDSIKIAKLLAGNTKPLMRLIGAPYWELIWSQIGSYKPRLQNAIELERMQWAWCQEEDIEIMTEGDTCPRPRYRVPSAYLEIFDTAMRAAGVGHGIHKYMLDYTSSARYETGYIDRHLKNAQVYADIERIFGTKTPCGVRVYETMKKFCGADLSGISDREAYAENLFFSPASKMLSDCTIPITYSGNTGALLAKMPATYLRKLLKTD